MANIFKDFISQVIQGDTVKGWDHASKLFVASNYALAPKNTFLYHVFFDLNPNAEILNNVKPSIKQIELGMLVKQISLPKFSIDTKALNAYNRKHIVQTKINYDPVNITFHDDAANVVRNFWFDYYSYYYRNSDDGGSQSLERLNASHGEITSFRNQKDWGYTIRGSQDGQNIKEPYLTAIRIYSLFNKEFSEYVLVNPIIKSFAHGEHNSSGTDPLTHQMTVEYETVMYAYGSVEGNVKGFADLHYDKSPSPLTPAGGGTKSIFGQGGIAQSVGEISNDLVTGNVGSAIFKGARVGNTLKGANLGSMLLPEAISMGKAVIAGSNPFGGVNVPGFGGLFTGAAGSKSSGINDLVTGVGTSAGSGSAYATTGYGPGLATASKNLTTSSTNPLAAIGTGITNLVSSVTTGIKGIMPSNLSSATNDLAAAQAEHDVREVQLTTSNNLALAKMDADYYTAKSAL